MNILGYSACFFVVFFFFFFFCCFFFFFFFLLLLLFCLKVNTCWCLNRNRSWPRTKYRIFIFRGIDTFSREANVKITVPLFLKGTYFKVDFFRKGVCLQESKQGLTKIVSLIKHAGKFTKGIQSP